MDNGDAPTVPPGKPLKSLGFSYYGGLCRNATLLVTDPLHISDVFEANEVAGGGIFVRTESANACRSHDRCPGRRPQRRQGRDRRNGPLHGVGSHRKCRCQRHACTGNAVSRAHTRP